MGAIKAGVTVVTFDEKENQDALDTALGSSNAKGLIFSPSTKMEDGKGTAGMAAKQHTAGRRHTTKTKKKGIRSVDSLCAIQ